MTIALAVLLGCLVLAVIQGAFSGDPMMAVRATIVEVPRSIFGMATVVALTGVLVTVVDGASAAVLPNVGANFGDWFAKSGVTGFFGSFVAGLVLLGALLTWVELVVRQGLVFLLVALSPMALAVRVWPAAAGLWRRFVELGVALIVSKFVIALALALGSDALGRLGGRFERGEPDGDDHRRRTDAGGGAVTVCDLAGDPRGGGGHGRPGDQPHAGPGGDDRRVHRDQRGAADPPGRQSCRGAVTSQGARDGGVWVGVAPPAGGGGGVAGPRRGVGRPVPPGDRARARSWSAAGGERRLQGR